MWLSLAVLHGLEEMPRGAWRLRQGLSGLLKAEREPLDWFSSAKEMLLSKGEATSPRGERFAPHQFSILPHNTVTSLQLTENGVECQASNGSSSVAF
jgi:hypothetical protein